MQTNRITSLDNKFGGKANFCDQLYIFVWWSFFYFTDVHAHTWRKPFLPEFLRRSLFSTRPLLVESSNPDVCVEVLAGQWVFICQDTMEPISSWYRLFFKIFYSLNKIRLQTVLMSFDTLIVFLLLHSFHAIGSAS